MPILRQNSAAHPLMFFLELTGGGPATGKTPTVTLSKNGGAFASPAGAVSELANGWYAVAGNAADTSTAGPLLLHATAASCDNTDAYFDCGLDVQLAADSLNNITCTDPGSKATTFPQMLVQIWRRFFKGVSMTTTALTTYQDDGVTPETTQTVSNDGTTLTQGSA